ncbi:energy transducer TonB [Sphingobacterium chuzhouense]|uniref:Energy transducer TonB n=1 Tax=Sphingobacterium chuzhouense TaxID=1742264 RepID=A0ABR7XWH1_9SPHI|nr:energy transducer TonB [Sphingobacterium chuzhouense]MBD1423414.1 energy transducer TonB [Sphingobacterium chuzhouense]
MRYWLFAFLLSGVFGTLSAQAPKDSLIVYDVDRYAQFNGGVTGWNRFVRENLDIRDIVSSIDSTTYVDYGLKQTAIMEFTVCEDGIVCDIEIVNRNKISPEFVEEALRVMKKSPKWMPALKNGKPVRTRFKQSIVAIL